MNGAALSSATIMQRTLLCCLSSAALSVGQAQWGGGLRVSAAEGRGARQRHRSRRGGAQPGEDAGGGRALQGVPRLANTVTRQAGPRLAQRQPTADEASMAYNITEYAGIDTGHLILIPGLCRPPAHLVFIEHHLSSLERRHKLPSRYLSILNWSHLQACNIAEHRRHLSLAPL